MKVIFVSLCVIAIVCIVAALYIFLNSNKIEISNDAAFQSITTLLAGLLALFGAYLTVQKIQDQIDVQKNQINEQKKENILLAQASVTFLYENYLNQAIEFDQVIKDLQSETLNNDTSSHISNKHIRELSNLINEITSIDDDIQNKHHLSYLLLESVNKIKLHEKHLSKLLKGLDWDDSTYKDFRGLLTSYSNFYQDIKEDINNIGFHSELAKRKVLDLPPASSFEDWILGIKYSMQDDNYVLEYTRYPRTIVRFGKNNEHIGTEYIDPKSTEYVIVDSIIGDCFRKHIKNQNVKFPTNFERQSGSPYMYIRERRGISLRSYNQ